jgi:uncharacterized protein (TIGR01777 family)
MMRIVVAGGSGFIGRHLSLALVADGHLVTVLTRARSVQRATPGGLLRYVHWNPSQPDGTLADVLSGTDAVVNLAGANLGSRRWTTRRKAELVDSRLRATDTLVRAIEFLDTDQRPRTLVNASGIDYYGHCREEVLLTEASSPGDTFLARLCQRWEGAATAARALGVRVVLMRTAVVLAPDALTLHLLAAPFRLFVGGPLGDGQQWFTWVHLDDVIGLYQWVLEREAISGPVNVVAPEVRPQWQVAHALGSVLQRPSALRTPAAVLRLAIGTQADLLLHGRRAVPAVATAQGYAFRAPELGPALRRCFRRGPDEEARLTAAAASPFFPVLGGAAEALPKVLREQYLLRPADDERVVLEGTMDRIWHRPFWLWPLFRLLAVFDILFPEQGSNIQASMTVEGLPNEYACGAQLWRRTFLFHTPRRFDATMAFDPKLARVVERVRPGGVLEVVWNVAFEPPATIRIVTEGMRLGVGWFRITLPRWSAVEVHVSETALEEQRQQIAVDLVVQHPWLGAIFGYAGRFQVRREPKEVGKA